MTVDEGSGWHISYIDIWICPIIGKLVEIHNKIIGYWDYKKLLNPALCDIIKKLMYTILKESLLQR